MMRKVPGILTHFIVRGERGKLNEASCWEYEEDYGEGGPVGGGI
jgi:hypothetical protein